MRLLLWFGETNFWGYLGREGYPSKGPGTSAASPSRRGVRWKLVPRLLLPFERTWTRGGRGRAREYCSNPKNVRVSGPGENKP